MLELFQTISRVTLAFLSGALLIVGTAFWADVFGGSESAFDEIVYMLRDLELKIIFAVITVLVAYIIGVINFAASSVAFKSLINTTKEELLLISKIESLQRPQLLKETVELLYLRRTLVAFTFPLCYLGLALACDYKEKSFTDAVRIAVGGSLIVLAGLSPLFAVRMSRLLHETANKLLVKETKQAAKSSS